MRSVVDENKEGGRATNSFCPKQCDKIRSNLVGHHGHFRTSGIMINGTGC